MNEIEQRLRETSENCYNAYESWDKNRKDGKAREVLLDTIHELRKVASRLEIEVAVSERDEMTQKQLPIPPHRDAQRRGGKGRQENDSDGDDDNHGNRDHNDHGSRDESARKSVKAGMRRRSGGGAGGKKETPPDKDSE